MKKASILLSIISLPALALPSACSGDSPGGDSDRIAKGRETVAAPLQNSDGTWTYYSLEQNRQVGASTFGDSIADRQWAARTDWDIAVCGDLLRTNGGASGSGQGGVIVSDGDYSAITSAPADGYAEDVYE